MSHGPDPDRPFHYMNDDQIDRLLQKAPSELPVPRSFEREVWARIESEESLAFPSRVTRLAEAFFGWLARPMPALATLASGVVLGAVFGMTTGPDAGEAARAELVYVRSISPLGGQTTHEP